MRQWYPIKVYISLLFLKIFHILLFTFIVKLLLYSIRNNLCDKLVVYDKYHIIEFYMLHIIYVHIDI